MGLQYFYFIIFITVAVYLLYTNLFISNLIHVSYNMNNITYLLQYFESNHSY